MTNSSTTEEHPFWVVDQGWTSVDELEVGDFFLTDDGDLVDLDGINRRDGSFRVYNFEVEDFHTYFVSENGVLVHNTNCNPLDVGTYGHLSSRSIKDGMTPDHIPSFRAIQESVERAEGRKLTPKEIAKLSRETNTIVYETDIHKDFSRTYGGRNNPAQYQSDANDLEAAFRRDRDAIRPHLINKGHDPANIDRAFEELDARNRRAELYWYN